MKWVAGRKARFVSCANTGWRVVDTAPTTGMTALTSEIPEDGIAQDDQPGRRDPLGQHLVTQGEGGKRLQPRVQRGEDGFADGWHMPFFMWAAVTGDRGSI